MRIPKLAFRNIGAPMSESIACRSAGTEFGVATGEGAVRGDEQAAIIAPRKANRERRVMSAPAVRAGGEGELSALRRVRHHARSIQIGAAVHVEKHGLRRAKALKPFLLDSLHAGQLTEQ